MLKWTRPSSRDYGFVTGGDTKGGESNIIQHVQCSRSFSTLVALKLTNARRRRSDIWYPCVLKGPDNRVTKSMTISSGHSVTRRSADSTNKYSGCYFQFVLTIWKKCCFDFVLAVFLWLEINQLFLLVEKCMDNILFYQCELGFKAFCNL